MKVPGSGAMTHEVGVILSRQAKDLLPRWQGHSQCVHTALLFVTALTRSVTALSADYGHPERVKRVEGSFHRILDTLDSVLFPELVGRFFAFAQNDKESKVSRNSSGKILRGTSCPSE